MKVAKKHGKMQACQWNSKHEKELIKIKIPVGCQKIKNKK